MPRFEESEPLALDVEIEPDHPEAGVVDTVPAAPPSDDELQSMYPGEPPTPEGRQADAAPKADEQAP